MHLTRVAALCLAAACLLAAARPVSGQMTPTEKLAQQRRQQQQAAYEAQRDARRVATRRLSAPCVVPDSYYPLRTCKVSSSPQECGRGFNAWATFTECCRPGAGGAFPRGCTDFNKPVQCFIPGSFFPERTCVPTTNLTRCSFNWGQWPSEDECCAPGRAFPEGCSQPEPCWVGSEWFPTRKCATTDDRAVCTRGWGTYQTEEECCAAGKGAFASGCGVAEEADMINDWEAGLRDVGLIGEGGSNDLSQKVQEIRKVVAMDGPHEGGPGDKGYGRERSFMGRGNGYMGEKRFEETCRCERCECGDGGKRF